MKRLFDFTNDISVGGMTHHTSECNNWSNTGKVQENNRGKALRMHRVFEIRHILWVSSLHVVDQTSKESENGFID